MKFNLVKEVEDNLPSVLTGISVTLTVTALVTMYFGTKKSEEEIRQFDPEEKEYKKKVAVTRLKHLALPITLGVAAASCAIASDVENSKRIVALGGYALALEEKVVKNKEVYAKKLKEKLGIEEGEKAVKEAESDIKMEELKKAIIDDEFAGSPRDERDLRFEEPITGQRFWARTDEIEAAIKDTLRDRLPYADRDLIMQREDVRLSADEWFDNLDRHCKNFNSNVQLSTEFGWEDPASDFEVMYDEIIVHPDESNKNPETGEKVVLMGYRKDPCFFRASEIA